MSGPPIHYRSSKHAYQAAKTLEVQDRKIIAACLTPSPRQNATPNRGECIEAHPHEVKEGAT